MVLKMNEERFKYLMNTLPWNLSSEDAEEAKELKKKIQPALDLTFRNLFIWCCEESLIDPRGSDNA